MEIHDTLRGVFLIIFKRIALCTSFHMIKMDELNFYLQSRDENKKKGGGNPLSIFQNFIFILNSCEETADEQIEDRI